MAESIAFCYPVKAGNEHKVEELMKHLLETERTGQHDRRSHELGLEEVKVWRQRTPVDMVIVYLKGADVHASMRKRATEGHEFDKWYDSMIEEITGVHVGGHHSEGPPSQLLFHWHHEKGHSRTHH